MKRRSTIIISGRSFGQTLSLSMTRIRLFLVRFGAPSGCCSGFLLGIGLTRDIGWRMQFYAVEIAR